MNEATFSRSQVFSDLGDVSSGFLVSRRPHYSPLERDSVTASYPALALEKPVGRRYEIPHDSDVVSVHGLR